MSLRPIQYSELGLFILLTAVAVWLMRWQESTLDAAAASTLAGALFGGAAILLGNWINRSNEWKRAAQDLDKRRAKLKKLISAELGIVAAGYLHSKNRVDFALALRADDSGHANPLPLPDQAELTRFLPRSTPLTNSLGVELLTLEVPAIDSLANFQGRMTITRALIQRNEGIQSKSGDKAESVQGAGTADDDYNSGLLRLADLSTSLRLDMQVLATCFDLIAPGHMLQEQDKSIELASTLLRRLTCVEMPS